jgi:hypothetical protein
VIVSIKSSCQGGFGFGRGGTSYVATGEVTALEHEVGDDTVESRALVAEALLASAEGTEVRGGLGDDVVKQVERDAARLSYSTR